jgi:uncharacterized protein YmfQ (DUF2313 family)
MTTVPKVPPDNPPLDRHVRRDGDTFGQQLLAHFPYGQAWTREPDSSFVRSINGLAYTWGFVDGRAADLLEIESDPRKTLELLPDWERAWGLPDPCFPDKTSIDERRDMLMLIMTLLGGQSVAFFELVSSWVGNEIKVREWAPFMCGISECGDTRYQYDNTGAYRWYIGRPENRFVWSVRADTAVLEWFRCGTPYSQCGVHPHLKIVTESPIDCLLQRWKPAHTRLVFDYSALQGGGPMAGTP